MPQRVEAPKMAEPTPRAEAPRAEPARAAERPKRPEQKEQRPVSSAPKSEEVVVPPTSPAAPQPVMGKPIQVVLNGQSLVLPAKEEGAPYYVMDLLEHSGIDFDNLDRGVELQVNGSNCSFMQELKARDDVVIRYLET